MFVPGTTPLLVPFQITALGPPFQVWPKGLESDLYCVLVWNGWGGVLGTIHWIVSNI